MNFEKQRKMDEQKTLSEVLEMERMLGNPNITKEEFLDYGIEKRGELSEEEYRKKREELWLEMHPSI